MKKFLVMKWPFPRNRSFFARFIVNISTSHVRSISTVNISSQENSPSAIEQDKPNATPKRKKNPERKQMTQVKAADNDMSSYSRLLVNQLREERNKKPRKQIMEDKEAETISFTLEEPICRVQRDGKPLITVMGVGGAGGNALNNMIASQLEGIEFVAANTDSQALGRSLAHRKIILGGSRKGGLGAGAKPEMGRISAENNRKQIQKSIAGSNMLFITGGMGGGTCTGAAPVIARIAKEMGILTVGVVSTPFRSEGPYRTRIANAGVKELSSIVDTMIIVPNQNLLALSNSKTTMLEAFRYADDVLLDGVKGVTDLIVKPGLINLDFADINTILCKAGRAIMGSGMAEDGNRAEVAANRALSNPLLGELPTHSASGLLVTISGGPDLTLFEVDQIMDIIRSKVSEKANIIFGTCYDESLSGKLHVSVIIGGIKSDDISPQVGKLSQENEEKNLSKQETKKESNTTGFLSRFFSF